jgi:hypothetical protein
VLFYAFPKQALTVGEIVSNQVPPQKQSENMLQGLRDGSGMSLLGLIAIKTNQIKLWPPLFIATNV